MLSSSMIQISRVPGASFSCKSPTAEGDKKLTLTNSLSRCNDSLVTVRTLVLTSAVIWIRPLLSVWSVPHRLGTLATQRLWMFIMQSVETVKTLVISKNFTLNGIPAFRNQIRTDLDLERANTYGRISCPGE